MIWVEGMLGASTLHLVGAGFINCGLLTLIDVQAEHSSCGSAIGCFRGWHLEEIQLKATPVT